MSTRSLTIFSDEDDTEIVVMYRQMDGYPSGHGQELAKFLAGMTMTKGIRVRDDNDRTGNGMGCLAAQVIAHFKTRVGGVYLFAAHQRGLLEEYRYHVSGRESCEPTITVIEVGWQGQPDEVLFDGPASEVLAALDSA